MLKHETQVSIADYPNLLKGQSSTKYNNDKDILLFAGIGGKYGLKCWFVDQAGIKKSEPDDAILFQRVNFLMVFLRKVIYLYAIQSCYNFIWSADLLSSPHPLPLQITHLPVVYLHSRNL